MSEIIILLPSFIFALVAWRLSLRIAMVWVFVPTLTLVPLYMEFWFGGLSIQPLTPMIVGLALYGLVRGWKQIKLRITDFLAVAAIFTGFYADYHYRPVKIAIYAGVTHALLAVCPYIVGRTIIEQNRLRAEFCKMFVRCLAIVAVASLWEYRMTSSLFKTAATAVMGHQSRWDGAHLLRLGPRIEGPYAQPIICAVVFATAMFFQLWLSSANVWAQGDRRSWVKSKAFTRTIWIALGIGLLLTQSRGPLLGVLLGAIAVCIGYAKAPKRAALILAPVLLILGAGIYFYLDSYTSVSYRTIAQNGGSIDQQNAAYRRELITTYMPIVQSGGLWGWGSPFPIGKSWGFDSTQLSIDNEYLRVTVAEGYVGATVFILLVATSLFHVGRLILNTTDRQERLFHSAIFGALVCFSFSIATVFLGEPIIEIFFLLCGWSQSLPYKADQKATAVVFQWQRVFS